MIAAIRAEYCLTSILAKRAMITKSPPLVAVLVLGFLLGPVTEETASGEDTLPEDFTAAHRTLPFGTLVQVDNQKSGRSAVVRITDRGPFISGRIIDLSQVAARALGISGLTQVCLNMPGSRPVGQK